MIIPDTTNCPDACRAYRQWDEESIRLLALEHHREAYISSVVAETGRELFEELSTGLTFDDSRLHRQETDIAWTALMAFYGPGKKRLAYQNQILMLTERLAARLYQLIYVEAEKAAEQVLSETENHSSWE